MEVKNAQDSVVENEEVKILWDVKERSRQENQIGHSSGSRGTWQHIKETEEMYRRAGDCYKHRITAKNSTARDSSYIKESFKLWIRFVETGLGVEI